MQYWIPKALTVSVLFGLSGCSVFTDSTHEERNYRANAPVQVPSHLKQPRLDATYSMTESQFQYTEEAIGSRPPQQVITVAAGTWVEQDEQLARVFFDKNDGIDDLVPFIWRAIENVTVQKQVPMTVTHKDMGHIETGWYSVILPSAKWFWQEDTVPSEQRYRFSVEPSEHQRTASLKAELIDYRSDAVELDGLLKQQLEVRALNEVIAEFDFLYRSLLVEIREKQGNLSFEMGFDPQGNTAFTSDFSQETVLDRLANLLERVNFTIVKLDREESSLLVRYEKPDSGVWDSIWGDEAVQLPLANGDYTIDVSKLSDEKSALTWRDENSVLLSNEKLLELQQSLVSALSDKGLSL